MANPHFFTHPRQKFAGTPPIEPTLTHQLYSAGRRQWVAAGDLIPGETLHTAHGPATIAQIQRKPGIHRVYNLEIETEHQYYVSQHKLLAHNASACKLGGAGKTPVSRSQRWKQLAAEGNLSKQEIDYIHRHGGEGMYKTFGKELAHRPGRPAARGFDYSEAIPKTAVDHRGIQHRYLIERRTGTSINLESRPRTGGALDLPPKGALP